jgi:hypothetical protein
MTIDATAAAIRLVIANALVENGGSIGRGLTPCSRCDRRKQLPEPSNWRGMRSGSGVDDRTATPLPASLARRQDAWRLRSPRGQRAGARVPLQPRQRGRGAAGEGAHERRGAADRAQCSEVAGVSGVSTIATRRPLFAAPKICNASSIGRGIPRQIY